MDTYKCVCIYIYLFNLFLNDLFTLINHSAKGKLTNKTGNERVKSHIYLNVPTRYRHYEFGTGNWNWKLELEIGIWRLELKNWNLEIGIWRLELKIGIWKLEFEDWN